MTCLLERPADLSPWLERSAHLSPLLERLVDLSPSFERLADLYLQSKFTYLILSFQVQCGSMNILFTPGIFLLVACYRNLLTSVFFFGNLLILSVNGNICHWSINHILFPAKPLCWCYLVTALNLISSSSPAKLVYYSCANDFLYNLVHHFKILGNKI